MKARRTARVVSTLLASVLTLGMAGTAAHAEEPAPTQPSEGRGVPAISYEGIMPAPDACRLLDLGVTCSNYLDPDWLIEYATHIARGCNNDSLCKTATETAQQALAVAATCVGSAAEELGATFTFSVIGGSMDCGELVRQTVALADFAITVANDCRTEAIPTCELVFDAAQLGLAYAAGCAQGAVGRIEVLNLEETDPGCADALAVLYREAQGLLSYLTACLNGEDAGVCNNVRTIATYALDTLVGCTGELAIRLVDVPTPLPANGPVSCWAVLDQVNTAINGLLGWAPGLPTTVSPTPECTISVAPKLYDPVADANSDADGPPEQEDVDFLVPPCEEPEKWYETEPTSPTGVPASPGTLEEPGRKCAENEKWVWTAKKLPHAFFHIAHEQETNINTETYEVKLTLKGEGSFTFSYRGSVSGEGNILLAKVKADVESKAEFKISGSVEKTSTHKIRTRTTHHWAYSITKNQSRGYWETTHDDCQVVQSHRGMKAPMGKGFLVWYEPYYGGTPR